MNPIDSTCLPHLKKKNAHITLFRPSGILQSCLFDLLPSPIAFIFNKDIGSAEVVQKNKRRWMQAAYLLRTHSSDKLKAHIKQPFLFNSNWDYNRGEKTTPKNSSIEVRLRERKFLTGNTSRDEFGFEIYKRG